MKTRFYLLLSLLLIFASCKKDIVVPAPSSHRTLLVFMGGDNNLSAETYEKVEALRQAASNTTGRLLVFQDAADGGARLLEIKYNTNSRQGEIQVLKSYGSVKSSAAAVFKQVLNDVADAAPSSSYGLLYFSHGSGWLPQRALTQPFDFSPVATDQPGFSDLAAVIPDHFFDYIVFESCFTSGIEMLYELKDKTDFIVSSSAEIVSPGFTEIYAQLLPFLYEPEADLNSCAQIYYDHYNQQSGYYRSATVSVTDTKALPALADWVKKYADTTLPADQLNEIQHFDRYYGYSLFFDLEDYYQRISSVDSHSELSTLLSKAIPYKAATPQFLKDYNGFNISRFSGLTSYIPQDGFGYLNKAYKNLKWSIAVASIANAA